MMLRGPVGVAATLGYLPNVEPRGASPRGPRKAPCLSAKVLPFTLSHHQAEQHQMLQACGYSPEHIFWAFLLQFLPQTKPKEAHSEHGGDPDDGGSHAPIQPRDALRETTGVEAVDRRHRPSGSWRREAACPPACGCLPSPLLQQGELFKGRKPPYLSEIAVLMCIAGEMGSSSRAAGRPTICSLPSIRKLSGHLF